MQESEWKAVADELDERWNLPNWLVQLMEDTSWRSVLLIQVRTILITREPSVQSY